METTPNIYTNTDDRDISQENTSNGRFIPGELEARFSQSARNESQTIQRTVDDNSSDIFAAVKERDIRKHLTENDTLNFNDLLTQNENPTQNRQALEAYGLDPDLIADNVYSDTMYKLSRGTIGITEVLPYIQPQPNNTFVLGRQQFLTQQAIGEKYSGMTDESLVEYVKKNSEQLDFLMQYQQKNVQGRSQFVMGLGGLSGQFVSTRAAKNAMHGLMNASRGTVKLISPGMHEDLQNQVGDMIAGGIGGVSAAFAASGIGLPVVAGIALGLSSYRTAQLSSFANMVNTVSAFKNITPDDIPNLKRTSHTIGALSGIVDTAITAISGGSLKIAGNIGKAAVKQLAGKTLTPLVNFLAQGMGYLGVYATSGLGEAGSELFETTVSGRKISSTLAKEASIKELTALSKEGVLTRNDYQTNMVRATLDNYHNTVASLPKDANFFNAFKQTQLGLSFMLGAVFSAGTSAVGGSVRGVNSYLKSRNAKSTVNAINSAIKDGEINATKEEAEMISRIAGDNVPDSDAVGQGIKKGLQKIERVMSDADEQALHEQGHTVIGNADIQNESTLEFIRKLSKEQRDSICNG